MFDTIPCIKKAKWAIKWINDQENSYSDSLSSFAAVEGIFFWIILCFILLHRGLPGLTYSNELISR